MARPRVWMTKYFIFVDSNTTWIEEGEVVPLMKEGKIVHMAKIKVLK